MTSRINLLIELAKPVLVAKSDGIGYDVRREGEHRAVLTIGNVSLAFDGHNNFVAVPDANLDREVIELFDYADDPVRLGYASYNGGDSPAESLLFALAADLGYDVLTNPLRYKRSSQPAKV